MKKSKFTGLLKASSAGTTVVTAESGRSRSGKRADPEFTQITAYIRKSTHAAVKIKLLQEGQGRDFSDLTEALLAGWINQRT